MTKLNSDFDLKTSGGTDVDTKMGSLRAKMQTYNDEAEDLLRKAEEAGVDIRDKEAFESWLRDESPELATPVPPPADATSDSPAKDGQSPKEIAPNDPPKAAEPNPEDPKPVSTIEAEEMMDALLDAYDHDVNIGDKKRLVKWMADNNRTKESSWVDSLGTSDYYGALGGFFEGLAKMRAKAPKMMSSLTEQDAPSYPPATAAPAPAPDSPTATSQTAAGQVQQQAAKSSEPAPTPSTEPPTPTASQDTPPEASVEAPTEEFNSVLMDTYLEGSDVTRRATLVKDLSKSGYTTQAETISQMSLPGFFRMISSFFSWVAGAMAEDTGEVPQKKLSEMNAPADESEFIDSQDEEEREDEMETKDCGVDESVWTAASPSERLQILMDSASVGHSKAKVYSEWDWVDLPDVIRRYLAGEEPDAFLAEMRSLALQPLTLGRFTLPDKRPVAVMIESTTSPGVIGAGGVGVLDVASYGGYLEKTLPYLIHSTLSRMDENDKGKFAGIYHKFVESNDIIQLTELAGKMADVVEYADATQEGAELVKTFRFLSEFLNMTRASLDFTKKAMPKV